MDEPLNESNLEAVDAMPTTSTPAATLSDATIKASDLSARGLTHYTTPKPTDEIPDAPAPKEPKPAPVQPVPAEPTPEAQQPATLSIPGIDAPEQDPVTSAQSKYATAREAAGQSIISTRDKLAKLGFTVPDDHLIDPGQLHSTVQARINEALASPQANEVDPYGGTKRTAAAQQLRANLTNMREEAAAAIGTHTMALRDLNSARQSLDQATNEQLAQSQMANTRPAPVAAIPGLLDNGQPDADPIGTATAKYSTARDKAGASITDLHQRLSAIGEDVSGDVLLHPDRLKASVREWANNQLDSDAANEVDRDGYLTPKAEALQQWVQQQSSDTLKAITEHGYNLADLKSSATGLHHVQNQARQQQIADQSAQQRTATSQAQIDRLQRAGDVRNLPGQYAGPQIPGLDPISNAAPAALGDGAGRDVQTGSFVPHATNQTAEAAPSQDAPGASLYERAKNFLGSTVGAVAEGLGSALTGLTGAAQTISHKLDPLWKAVGISTENPGGLNDLAQQAGQQLRSVPGVITDPQWKDNGEAKAGRFIGGVGGLLAQGSVAPASLVPTLFGQGYTLQHDAAEQHAKETGQPFDPAVAEKAGLIGGAINAVLGIPFEAAGKVISSFFGKAAPDAVQVAFKHAYDSDGAAGVADLLSRFKYAMSKLGTSEAPGIPEALGKMKDATMNGLQGVIDEISKTAGQRAVTVAKRAALDAGLGASTQVAQNVVSQSYAPETSLLQGVPESAAQFAAIGGLFGTLDQAHAASRAEKAKTDIKSSLAKQTTGEEVGAGVEKAASPSSETAASTPALLQTQPAPEPPQSLGASPEAQYPAPQGQKGSQSSTPSTPVPAQEQQNKDQPKPAIPGLEPAGPRQAQRGADGQDEFTSANDELTNSQKQLMARAAASAAHNNGIEFQGESDGKYIFKDHLTNSSFSLNWHEVMPSIVEHRLKMLRLKMGSVEVAERHPDTRDESASTQDELAQLQRQVADSTALQEQAKREGNAMGVALYGKEIADAKNRLAVLESHEQEPQTPQEQAPAERVPQIETQPPVPASQEPASDAGRVPAIPGLEPEPLSNAETQKQPVTNTPPASPASEPPAGTTSLSGDAASSAPISDRYSHLTDLNSEELDARYREAKDADKNLERDIFGEEEAKRYRSLLSKENSYDSKISNAASAERSAMEEALTEKQRNRLFGIGEQDVVTPEEIRDIHGAVNFVENADSAEDLGSALKFAAVNFDPDVEGADLTFKQAKALAEMKAAARLIQERGWNPNEVAQSMIQHAASRFSDPNDAAFMLDKLMRYFGRDASPAVKGADTTTGGREVSAPVARKPLAIPGLPEIELSPAQLNRIRQLKLISSKRELRPVEQKELNTLEPQTPAEPPVKQPPLRIPGLDNPEESLSNPEQPGNIAAPTSHEPIPPANEPAESRGRDNRDLGDARGTEVGRLSGESGSDKGGREPDQRSIDRVGKFLRRDGGHEAHLKRLAVTLRHVEPEAAPGGMAMTPRGELLYSKNAIDERLHKLAPHLRIPYAHSLLTEELIHRSQFFVQGSHIKAESAKIWSDLKQSNPELSKLVTGAYRSAKSDAQKGAEFLRMLVQERLGMPISESFYRDTAALEKELAKKQTPELELLAGEVGSVLLHSDAKEFPDAIVPAKTKDGTQRGALDIPGLPSLAELMGEDILHADAPDESPDSLVGKAVSEASEHLSREQREVLEQVRKGKPVDEIAKSLAVQPAEVTRRLTEANQALDKAREAAVSELTDHIRQYEPDPLHDLQAKVRTLASTIGSKMGLARAMMKAATLGQQQGKAEHDFIDRQKTEIHKLATEVINDALPVSERARYLDALSRVLSTRVALRRGNETVVENLFKRTANIASNVLNRAEELRKEAVVQAIKKTASRVADSPSVDVVYKTTIHDRVKNLDFHRPAARTVSRLTDTKDYIDRKEQGADGHAVPEAVIDELDRLNKLPIRDLPTHVLDHMLSDILMLEKLGRLKVKTRAAVRESRRQFALGEMARSKTTPLNLNPIKVAQPGQKLALPDAFRNKVNKALNRAAVLDRALLPMAAVADALGDGKGNYNGALERHVHGRIDTAYNDILVARDELLHPMEDLIAKHNLTEQDSQRFAVYATLQQADGEHRLLEQGVTPETIASNRTLSPQLAEVYDEWQKIEQAIFPAVQKAAREEFNQHVAKVEHYFPMLRDHDSFVPNQAPIETAPGSTVQYEPMAMLQNLRDDFNPVPKKNAEAGFTKERVKGAGTPIRLDGFEVIRRHVGDATHFIHMQPVLSDVSAIVSNPVFLEKYGQGGQTIYRDYIDTIARQGGVDATKRIAWMDTLRRNLGLAGIGFRLASNLKHASNMGLAMYHAGPGWYAKGMRVALSGEAEKWIEKHMAEIKARHGAEPAQEEIETGKPVAQWAGKASLAAQKYAFYVARKIDKINATATAIGAYMSELAAAGRDPDNYLNEPVDRARVNRALIRMRRAVASPNPKDQPQALTRGTGLGDNASIAKTFLAFQNVFLDQWSNLRHDFARAGIKEKNPNKALMIGLAILATTLLETGIEHFVKSLENTVTGQKEDDKHHDEFSHSFLINGLRRFPFMGQIIGAMRYGGSGIPVVDSLLVTPLKEISKLTSDKPMTDQAKVKTAIDLAKTAGSVIGVPGVGYAGDMAKKAANHFVPKPPTRANVVDEVRHGDSDAIQKALAAGTVKTNQIAGIRRDAQMTQLQAKVRHLPLDKAEALYKDASSEEKRQMEPIMREKRARRLLFTPTAFVR